MHANLKHSWEGWLIQKGDVDEIDLKQKRFFLFGWSKTRKTQLRTGVRGFTAPLRARPLKHSLSSNALQRISASPEDVWGKIRAWDWCFNSTHGRKQASFHVNLSCSAWCPTRRRIGSSDKKKRWASLTDAGCAANRPLGYLPVKREGFQHDFPKHSHTPRPNLNHCLELLPPQGSPLDPRHPERWQTSCCGTVLWPGSR